MTETIEWQEIKARLEGAYGPPQRPRTLSPLDELISTILSQNTSDQNRDRAFDSLKAAFSSWAEVIGAPPAMVIQTIRMGGLAPTKGPRIQAVLQRIEETFGCFELPESSPPEELFSFLLSLPGVGPKTARIVLLFSRGEPRFPIDRHIERVGRRLGLIASPTSLTQAMERLDHDIPASLQLPLHLLLIEHGRRTCRPRPRCPQCPLVDRCPSSGAFGPPSR
ncbi:MAG: endonuclease III [Coprothermobacterota bacterium]|nr:endonuclease III [Coprothermobacterota bacterium]